MNIDKISHGCKDKSMHYKISKNLIKARVFKGRASSFLNLCLIISIITLSGCHKRDAGMDNDNQKVEDGTSTERNSVNSEDLTQMKPELYMLVEGAVDAWFFYNLHDYRSYEPLIRETNYNEEEDYYIHKCRYRASTLGGGYETEEKTFKVVLQIDSTGLKDFQVEDITGHKSPTEKEE